MEAGSISEAEWIQESKRMKGKISMLERNIEILNQEHEIAKGFDDDNKNSQQLTEELQAKIAENSAMKQTITTMSGKLQLILCHLKMEKKALFDIKSDCQNCTVESLNMAKMHMLELSRTISDHDAKQEAAYREELNKAVTAHEITLNDMTATVQKKEQALLRLESALNKAEVAVQHQTEESSQRIKKVSDRITAMDEQHRQALCEMAAEYRTKMEKSTFEMQSYKDENDRLKENVKHLEVSLLTTRQDLQDAQAREVHVSDELTEGKVLLQQMKDQLEESRKEKASSEESFTKANIQVQQLLTLNSSLQKDFNGAIAKEEQLRKEMSDVGSNSKDVHFRLKSITLKVKEIEESHIVEMEKISTELGLQRSRANDAQSLLEQENHKTHLLKLSFEADEFQWSQEKDDLLAKILNLESLLVDQKQLEALATSKLAELTESNHTLQANHSDIQSKLDKKLQEGKEQMKKISLHVVEQQKMAKALEAEQKAVRLGAEQLKLALGNQQDQAIANAKLVEKEDLINNLKVTVQRECEERTEMMIQMSELKDYASKLLVQVNSIGSGRGDEQFTPSQPAQSVPSTAHNRSQKLSSGSAGKDGGTRFRADDLSGSKKHQSSFISSIRDEHEGGLGGVTSISRHIMPVDGDEDEDRSKSLSNKSACSLPALNKGQGPSNAQTATQLSTKVKGVDQRLCSDQIKPEINLLKNRQQSVVGDGSPSSAWKNSKSSVKKKSTKQFKSKSSKAMPTR